MENEPKHIANLNLPDGEKLAVTTDNIRLYQHMGRYAVYDHLFVTVNESEGLFIWAQQPPDNTNYTMLAPLVVENQCEMHLFIREPNKHDVETFERHAIGNLDDTPDWLPSID